jgi:SPX domain protein involved in polyphosphate accumulation
MKFGRSFQEAIISEWRFYYMDYNGMKQMIKERTSEGSFFAEVDEAAFVERLEAEMQKVFDFRDVKAGELTRHVQYCENSLSLTGEQAKQELLNEIDRITMELSNLSSFSRSNYTAFVKILKKHDKHTEFMLKPMFMMRLNPRMQQNELLDSLIYRLSKLYDKIRRGTQDELEKNAQGDTQAFVRKTTKYWVHPDNVMEVKCAILRYLPVLVFPTAERQIDPAINSVYLDNDKFEMYKGRIEKSENAEAIRLRWYGSANKPNTVFVERKTHREDWTGEVSVKERFQIKEKHLDDFLKGTFTPEDVCEKLRKLDEGGSEENLEVIYQLAKQVQDKILVSALSPTVRTFYNRTAFQLPGDARVRISLDTELCMIDETLMETNGFHWKRRDVGSSFPFSEVPSSQIVRFPYAILEVKLQVENEGNIPDWIANLTAGPLVPPLFLNVQ